MLLLIFVHLILSTPLQNVSHVVFLTLKKIILCFYTPQLTGALFFFLHCQTSRKQYALPIFTASSLTDTSAPCKLNFLLSLSHSLKCPRYISFVPKFSALLPQSYFPTISLLHLVLLKVHAFGNTSLCLDDTSASLIALLCLFWFFLFVFCFTELSFTFPDLFKCRQSPRFYLYHTSLSFLALNLTCHNMLDVSQITSPYLCSVFQSLICNCQLNIFTCMFSQSQYIKNCPYYLNAFFSVITLFFSLT